eukprot:CAMPEP_0184694268 /NCGR_PEP_ID=MMETSP0313-20130426/2285_1 /TAXON_ID=2792 /ORGANISM="Porphyridium aerugineum, Strain SAG 1380-2" /LENGTH=824 /DNA_ID=CAMNT_0027152533 /DNA_START=143 /DNA_END=2613 /DNA_ORIENTATION=-
MSMINSLSKATRALKPSSSWAYYGATSAGSRYRLMVRPVTSSAVVGITKRHKSGYNVASHAPSRDTTSWNQLTTAWRCLSTSPSTETEDQKPESGSGTGSGETMAFQADVARVMDIIINSLYSHPEVFIRELVSNASDAVDKRRLLSQRADSKFAQVKTDMVVRVSVDDKQNLIIVEDTGVGMTRKELIDNLGSIASSGTKRFAEQLKSKGENKDMKESLIGQFGVGFYSTFLVADRMVVVTKSLDENVQWIWTSDRAKGYTIKEDTEKKYGEIDSCGTRVIVHVRDDQAEFSNIFTIKDLLKKYTEFISVPVQLRELRAVLKADKETKEGEEQDKVKEKDKAEQKQEVDDTEYEEYWSTVNDQKPLWLRNPKDVTPEEYTELFRAITKEYEHPLAKSHFAAEGEVEFRCVLFVPARVPRYLTEAASSNSGPSVAMKIKLYVKRVFITDQMKGMLPNWMAFVSGVVDSDDLPLNVSREMLQKTRALNIICKQIERKTLSMLTAMSEDPDQTNYIKFWESLGGFIKAGITEGTASKDLLPFLRFKSIKSDGKWIKLGDYISRMPADQKHIFYVTAGSRAEANASPYLKSMIKKGCEVLYSTDEVEHLMLSQMIKYTGKRTPDGKAEQFSLEDITSAAADKELKADDQESKAEAKEEKVKYKTLCDQMKKILGSDKILDVQISSRLSDSGVPAAIARDAYNMSPAMEKILKLNQKMQMMQSRGAAPGDDGDEPKMPFIPKTLQLNPKHIIVESMLELSKNSVGESELKEWTTLLFETALMRAGYEPSDSNKFINAMDELLSKQALDGGRNQSKTKTEAKSKVELIG